MDVLYMACDFDINFWQLACEFQLPPKEFHRFLLNARKMCWEVGKLAKFPPRYLVLPLPFSSSTKQRCSSKFISFINTMHSPGQ